MVTRPGTCTLDSQTSKTFFLSAGYAKYEGETEKPCGEKNKYCNGNAEIVV